MSIGPKISSVAIRALGLSVTATVGPTIPPAAGEVLALDDDLGLFARQRLVAAHTFVRVGVDERSTDRAQVMGRSDRNDPRGAGHSLDELVEHGIERDHRDAAEHFWPAYANALCTIAGTATIEVGVGVDDDRVLAAHLGEDPLDLSLPGPERGRTFDDLQADGLRAGEGDERDRRVLDQGRRRPPRRRLGGSASTPGGTPASWRTSTRRSATPGVCSAGLNSTAFPATSAAVTMPVGIASGKFHGEITTPMPSGS